MHKKISVGVEKELGVLGMSESGEQKDECHRGGFNPNSEVER